MSDSPIKPAVQLLRSAPAMPLAERDDESLMILAAGEHRAAFEVLVNRYMSRLTHYCVKFLGGSRSGEELAQEILLEVWARRKSYRAKVGFPVFLFTVARNRCLNHARDQGRRRRWDVAPPASGGAEAVGADAPDQLDALLERERAQRVRSALLELPPKLREAVLLRFEQGLEYPEIARIVGRPESTVRSRVFLAMKTLRQGVAGEGEP